MKTLNRYVASFLVATSICGAFSSQPVWAGQETAAPEVLAPIQADTRLTIASLTASSVVLKYMLEASGADAETKIRLFDEALSWLRRFALQPETRKTIRTVTELNQLRQSLAIESLNLRDEIAQRRSLPMTPKITIVTRSASVLDELDKIQAAQLRRIQEISTQLTGNDQGPIDLSDKKPSEIVVDLLGRFGINSKTLLTTLAMAALPPQSTDEARFALQNRLKLKVVNLFESSFENLISEVQDVGGRLANSDQIQINNPAMKTFFQIMIGEYFRRMDRSSLKDIISTLIETPERDSVQERFEVMVQHAGPQFQKLFQVYSRQQGFSSELKRIFERLEDSVKAVPWVHVRKVIESHAVPFEWVSIDEKPLGVGTMAQVHLAVIQFKNGQQREVVVRIIKPGILEKLASDNRILREVAVILDADPQLRAAGFPLMTPFLKEIEEMTRIEAVVDNTVANQRRGSTVYNSEFTLNKGRTKTQLEIHVPDIIPLKKRGTMMIQEFVKSVSLDSYAEKNPGKTKLVIEQLARLWVEKSLVGEGFFHADLHQGNIRVAEKDGKIVLYLLDFGMTGKMSRRLQSRFMALGIVTMTEDAALISRALWEISKKKENRTTRAQFNNDVKQRIADLKANGQSLMAMADWVAFAVNAGLKFPPEFTSLNRGAILMFQMLANVESSTALPGELKRILIRQPGRLKSMLTKDSDFSPREWAHILWSAYQHIRRLPPEGVQSAFDTPTTAPISEQAPQPSQTAPARWRCEDLFKSAG